MKLWWRMLENQADLESRRPYLEGNGQKPKKLKPISLEPNAGRICGFFFFFFLLHRCCFISVRLGLEQESKPAGR